MLLNGEFALERAQRWAASLLAGCKDDRALVTQAYRAAWGRPATAEEIALGVKFLGQATAADFCHALLNSNEFLYAD